MTHQSKLSGATTSSTTKKTTNKSATTPIKPKSTLTIEQPSLTNTPNSRTPLKRSDNNPTTTANQQQHKKRGRPPKQTANEETTNTTVKEVDVKLDSATATKPADNKETVDVHEDDFSNFEYDIAREDELDKKNDDDDEDNVSQLDLNGLIQDEHDDNTTENNVNNHNLDIDHFDDDSRSTCGGNAQQEVR